MRYISLLVGTFLIASTGNAALAQSCAGGQEPAPPAMAEQLALPICGFAATESWGPNGCQWCVARNMHPNPLARRPSLKVSPVVFGDQRKSTDPVFLTDGGHHASYSRCYPV